MRGFIANTDHDWYRFLHARPELDEVNFWRPGGGNFVALGNSEPFFFKLKSPYNAIGGFGLFARFQALPVWQAWDVFGQANGAPDEADLLRRLARLAAAPQSSFGFDRTIGCIAVVQPVFFAPDEWVAQPADWQPQIVAGKGYDLTMGEGARIWRECLDRARSKAIVAEWVAEVVRQRTGAPQVIRPRLGQGSFRLAVLDAYRGACAVTREHSLPVLEAAHIRPWSAGGMHEIPNGLPLRRDLHRLFDLGYVTVRPDRRFAVSRDLAEVWSNGRSYYELQDREIAVPETPALQPSSELLEWHSETVFRG